MSDDSHLWNHEPPRLPQPRPREHVWTMRKPDGHLMEAQLLNQGEYGVEVQFFFDAIFHQIRRWQTRTEALAEAGEKGRDLEREGWQSA